MRGILLSACAVGLSASVGQSAIVLSYDTGTNGSGSLAARTVQQNLDLDADTANDDSRVIRAFADVGGSAWSTGASYTGPAMYGGFVGESINNANRGTDDYTLSKFALRYQTNGTNETGRLHLALIFDANPAQPLKFDTGVASTSSMRVSGDNSGNLGRLENLGAARFLVRNGSTLYVSQSTIANTAAGRVLDATELATEQWAVYNPTDAFAFNLSLNFDTPTSSLTNMNAFGLITYKSSFSAVRHWLDFTEFYVDAVPVPEPTTLASLALAGLIGLRRRR